MSETVVVGYVPYHFRGVTTSCFLVSPTWVCTDRDAGQIIIKTVEKNLVDIPLVAPFEREGSSSIPG